MLSGHANFDLRELLFPKKNFDSTRGGLTDSEIEHALRALQYPFHVHLEPRTLPKKRCLVIVPSLNESGHYHCIYWNGTGLCDPALGAAGKKYHYCWNGKQLTNNKNRYTAKIVKMFVIS